MTDGIVFDFNGTLFFDSEYHLRAFDQLKYEICGEHMDMAEMEHTCAGVPNVEIFKRLSKGKLSDEECLAYSLRKEEMYREAVAKTNGGPKLCKGSEELFSFLKQKGIPFTIASASIKENIDFFVEIFGLDKWIHPASIVYDDGRYHDKTEMFKEAFYRLSIDGRKIVLEDSVSGIQCASLCGAEIIAVYNPSLQKVYEETEAVIATVENMSEALPIIQKVLKK